MKRILLFASGSGTNVENIIRYFQQKKTAEVVAVFCNNPKAKVIERAKNLSVDSFVFSKEDLFSEIVFDKVNEFKPDLIVLAGFLLKFPQNVIAAYPNQIINIHPALLPKYGGKGMYGKHVHQAVLDNKESETGITIHYIDEHYDEGDIIFQKSISVTDCSSPEEIAAKIGKLEHEYFPQIIENLLKS
ncbi:phosphoribosylglycinamide formyltransferase [Flavobacterium sp.]|jgi:phosphoribosylglycinamide formyltransferase-1|uniref:phosphoribosylglycinamide formyltransferase n=1 Tax=Flavobacterium sp. TaxID=239 RepID=UPI0037BF06CE